MASQKFKSGVSIQGGDLGLPQQTASRALITDASKNIVTSSVTSTELGHVSGVTSAIQTQIDSKASATNVANLITLSGVAANAVDLGSFTGTTIPDSSTIKAAIQALETSLETVASAFTYKGVYNATTNSPALANTDTGKIGFLYYVTVAGSQDFGAGSISFSVGDKVANNGTTWDKWDMTDEVGSVFGRTGAVTAQSGDYNTSQVTENTNLYFTDERAQDAVGTILVDTASINATYNDATPSIVFDVIPGGVDHDSLLNFVANKHIDHSAVEIQTGSNSGLSGGGNITSTRSLVVDITGTTAETVPAAGDEILIYDVSAAARRKMTRANFLSGIAVASAGDINETSFSAANNQAVAANVTGLAFANGVVRSFRTHVSVTIDATADLFEVFELNGIQKGADWDLAVSSVGDDSGIVFSITPAGQIQYTSTNLAGFVSDTMKFRAETTSV